MHQSVVPIIRFFYHDDISSYFRAYLTSLSAFLTSFYYCCVLTRFSTRYQFAHRIFLHDFRVIHYVPNDNFLSPMCVFTLFSPFSATFLAMLSIYIVFAFSRGSSSFRHICSRVGYYFPIVPTSCSTYDDGTQLHYRQQLRLEASDSPPER